MHTATWRRPAAVRTSSIRSSTRLLFPERHSPRTSTRSDRLNVVYKILSPESLVITFLSTGAALSLPVCSMRTSASTRGVVHGSLALLTRNATSAASLNSTSISMDSVDQHASERRSGEVDDLAMLLDELKSWDGPSVFVTSDSLFVHRLYLGVTLY